MAHAARDQDDSHGPARFFSFEDIVSTYIRNATLANAFAFAKEPINVSLFLVLMQDDASNAAPYKHRLS